MLENLLSETKTISYTGCLVQCFFFIALVHVEVFILAVMAFDRYMAIGNPLLYGSKMSRVVCIWLISFPYVYGFLISLAATLWTYGLYFCGKIEINYFYCADPPLIKMACAGTFVKEYTMIVLAGINFTYSLTVLIISYLFILIAILRMNSAEGRRKAFSTCGSHVLRNPYFHVSQTSHRGVCGAGEDGGCVLHRGDPHVEPHDLQSEEQRCERSHEQSDRQDSFNKLKLCYFCSLHFINTHLSKDYCLVHSFREFTKSKNFTLYKKQEKNKIQREKVNFLSLIQVVKLS